LIWGWWRSFVREQLLEARVDGAEPGVGRPLRGRACDAEHRDVQPTQRLDVNRRDESGADDRSCWSTCHRLPRPGEEVGNGETRGAELGRHGVREFALEQLQAEARPANALAPERDHRRLQMAA
jgi:hypothetical protein